MNGPQVTLRVYKTRGGTKRMDPPVATLPHGQGATLRFKAVGNMTIRDVKFPTGGGYFSSYDPRTQTVVMSPDTPKEFYEYDLVVSSFVEVLELAQGNSSPGVLVDD